MKVIVSFIVLILSNFLYPSSVFAQIEHISLNERLFEVGKLPMVKVNIVTTNQDISNLEFVLVQKDNEEKLIVQQLNQFSLLLMGLDKVTDINAKLVVRQWQPIKDIALFDKDYVERHLAAVEAKRAPKEVAINKSPLMISQANMVQDSASCLLEYDGNQTLWRLGLKYAESWDTSIYAAMLVIFYENTQAFNNGGINGLRKDAVLRCPEDKLLTIYADPVKAKTLYNKLSEK
ncbi:hypothetical protein [Shewanella putrefaciens]|uniref:hypothetical protein n=1 Tax=Shewanella putrefaciens TaxID=24 RepID=UPI0028554063|nr:hypothetical protein [Shewanella putrefaciens]MDR6965092.1 hypothetical protein [Shewanella putrefaciens]